MKKWGLWQMITHYKTNGQMNKGYILAYESFEAHGWTQNSIFESEVLKPQPSF